MDPTGKQTRGKKSGRDRESAPEKRRTETSPASRHLTGASREIERRKTKSPVNIMCATKIALLPTRASCLPTSAGFMV